MNGLRLTGSRGGIEFFSEFLSIKSGGISESRIPYEEIDSATILYPVPGRSFWDLAAATLELASAVPTVIPRSRLIVHITAWGSGELIEHDLGRTTDLGHPSWQVYRDLRAVTEKLSASGDIGWLGTHGGLLSEKIRKRGMWTISRSIVHWLPNEPAR